MILQQCSDSGSLGTWQRAASSTARMESRPTGPGHIDSTRCFPVDGPKVSEPTATVNECRLMNDCLSAGQHRFVRSSSGTRGRETFEQETHRLARYNLAVTANGGSPDSGPLTIAQIAERAGVSVATVSKVVNGRPVAVDTLSAV